MASWQQLTETLPPLVVERLNQPASLAPKPEMSDYEELLLSLPLDVQEALVAPDDSAAIPTVDDSRWLLCVSPEGEFPRLNIFPSLSQLCQEIAKLDGTETAVWAVYGIPLPVTTAMKKRNKQNIRYLLLPNMLAAEVTLSARETDVRVVSRTSLSASLDVQTDGWLGSPLLTTEQYFIPGYTSNENTETSSSDGNDNSGDSLAGA